MANNQHVQWVASGAAILNNVRQQQPNLVLDLTDANFRSLGLAGANLSGSNLRGARLDGTNLSQANLAGADISDANFTGAQLNEANLTEVTVTRKTIFANAILDGAKISADKFCNADVSRARLRNVDLTDADLSNRKLASTDFSASILINANFSNTALTHARLDQCALTSANFQNGDLSNASFMSANLTEADLRWAKLAHTTLIQAVLHSAKIYRADFYETILNGVDMDGLLGAYQCKNLLTTKTDPNTRGFEAVVRAWPERWLDWERIRIFGRLPLFGASYTGLIIIPTYVYFLGIYNEKIEALRTWIEHNSSSLPGSASILQHVHTETIPQSFFLLFLSTICLAIASTIYILACPSRIKAFSRDQWCDELGHSLVHYWPEAWKFRALRIICAAFYLIGGVGAVYVLGQKLLNVGGILWRSSTLF